MNKNYSLLNLNEIAKDIIKNSKHKVLLFHGEMGVGKTTLIKEICKELGTDDITSSPTFSIVNEYITSKDETIYHFDFYRLEDEQEAFYMGYEEYFFSDAYCFIEWPEKIPNLIEDDMIVVKMHLDGNKRVINVLI